MSSVITDKLKSAGFLAQLKQASPLADPGVASSWSHQVGRPKEPRELVDPAYRTAFTQTTPGGYATLRNPTGPPVDNSAFAKRWAAQAGSMASANHVFSRGPLWAEGSGLSRYDEANVPFIYHTAFEGSKSPSTGWRAPFYDSSAGAFSTIQEDPYAARDFIERTKELPTPVTYTIQEKENPRVMHWPWTAWKEMYLDPKFPAPYATATHEYEHALTGHPDVKAPSTTAERLRHFYNETPSVMAETVARMRTQNRLNPGSVAGLSFGDPEYNKSTGEFIRQQGSRYMYGRDPFTDQKLAPQRSMTDLLTTNEGKQWLARMGNKPVAPRATTLAPPTFASAKNFMSRIGSALPYLTSRKNPLPTTNLQHP